MARSFWTFPVALALSACASMGPHPYGPSSFCYLDLAADGSKLAGVSQDGTSKVWNLATRKVIHGVPGFDPSSPFGGYVAGFLTFRGETGEVVGDCGFGRICAWDLATGSKRLLLEHDAQDQAMAGLSSRDGRRLVFGTRRGAIFRFDEEAVEVNFLKPIDLWSGGGGGARPIYTLEGTRYLELIVSATSVIEPAGMYMRDSRSRPTIHRAEGWMEVPTTDGRSFNLALCSGICVWRWPSEEPIEIEDRFSDKIRADFSADGRRLAIHQQGGPGAVYDVGTMSQVVPKLTNGADGLRFIDEAAEYLAVMTYGEKKLRILTLSGGAAEAVDLPLRNWSAGGRRPMVTFPEKQWIFIGLRDGGVDWYQFSAAPTPALRHVATLR
ncbi:MAG: WD40 repeat domain-containing protein [Thermoanaerobaculia bacterium]|nr:MAG: WD40 repeat domain-containing protein [Thermoanaerobaculia bacterium]MBZ0101131.1 WD40 repeat domain-containing protein [Thermoanaerobaculia bacterium]